MSLIDKELKILRERLYEMAQLVVQQLRLTQKSLAEGNYILLQQVRSYEPQVDKYDVRIDRRSARIIALYQPVASDLRFILAVLRAHQYLEEIGDQLNVSARRILHLNPPIEPQLFREVPFLEMIELCQSLVQKGLEAFFHEDTQKSKVLGAEDNALDQLYQQILQTLIQKISSQPSKAALWIELVLFAKSLEKIADYAVAIAEASIYHVEGIAYWHREKK